MTDLQYRWLGATSLADEIGQPLSQISLELEPQGRASRVTLWRSDRTGLRVQSEMHDLDERVEVGVLSFELVTEPKPEEKIVDLDPSFSKSFRAEKLVISEKGRRADSGLLLRSSSGEEILIVASAHPYQLAVKGVLSTPHIFEPEYPQEQYKAEPLA